MNFATMLRVSEAGMTSLKGMMLMEVFRLAGAQGRGLRLPEIREVLPRATVEHLLGDGVRLGLLESHVVPEMRNSRMYALSAKGRELLGIDAATPVPARVHAGEWTAAEEKELGRLSDEETAKKLGRSVASVRVRRQALKIPMKGAKRPGRWKKSEGGYAFR